MSRATGLVPFSVFEDEVGYRPATEAESKEKFDRLIEQEGLFTSYSEVAGTLDYSPVGKERHGMRIDRILVPKPKLLDAGWQYGSVGVEIKAENSPLGKAVLQALDYRMTTWRLNSEDVQLRYVFVFPFVHTGGDMESVMTQWNIGTAHASYGQLHWYVGCLRILDDGVPLNNQVLAVERKSGSR